MADCIFCAIGAGTIPSTVVADSDAVLAFRDVNPKSETHVLVIPKAHYDNLGEVAAADPALAAQLIHTAAEVAAGLGIADRGYRLIANTGAGGGQTVFHAHLHLMAGASLPGF